MRLATTVLLLIVVGVGHAFAGECPIDSPTAFKRSVNQTGKEFYVTFPPVLDLPTDTIATHTLVMYGLEYQEVTVYSAKTGYTETRALKPYEIVRWEIPYDAAQVYRHYSNADLAGDTVFDDAAVYVQAEQAIALMVETRIGSKIGRYTATARETAGREHMVLTLPEKLLDSDAEELRLPSRSFVLGLEYDTDVEVVYHIQDGPVASTGRSSGDTVKYTLHRGDILQLSTDTLSENISGTTILSSKPTFCFNSTYEVFEHNEDQYCDVAFSGDSRLIHGQSMITTLLSNTDSDSTILFWLGSSGVPNSNAIPADSTPIGYSTLYSTSYLHRDSLLISSPSLVRNAMVRYDKWKDNSDRWNLGAGEVNTSKLFPFAGRQLIFTGLSADVGDSSILHIMSPSLFPIDSLYVVTFDNGVADSLAFSSWLAERSYTAYEHITAHLYAVHVPRDTYINLVSRYPFAATMWNSDRDARAYPQALQLEQARYQLPLDLTIDSTWHDGPLELCFTSNNSLARRVELLPSNATIDSSMFVLDRKRTFCFYLTPTTDSLPIEVQYRVLLVDNEELCNTLFFEQRTTAILEEHNDAPIRAHVCPSPALDMSKLIVETTISGTLIVELFDNRGRLHSTRKVNARGEATLDVPSELNAGSWYYRISCNGRLCVVPFVKID